MKLVDELNWVLDGEDNDAEVFNRPLLELVTKIDNNDISSLSGGGSIKIESTDLGDAVKGQAVYKATDGKYYKLPEDDNNHIFVGVVGESNGNYSIITQGAVDVTDYVVDASGNSVDVVIGAKYYISPVVSGSVTSDLIDRGLLIGIGDSANTITLLSIRERYSDLPLGFSIEESNIVCDSLNQGDPVSYDSDNNKIVATTSSNSNNFLGVYNIVKNEVGQEIVITNSGIIDYPSESFTAWDLVYVGENGGVTQTSYTGAVIVGVAINPTKLILKVNGGAGVYLPISGGDLEGTLNVKGNLNINDQEVVTYYNGVKINGGYNDTAYAKLSLGDIDGVLVSQYGTAGSSDDIRAALLHNSNIELQTMDYGVHIDHDLVVEGSITETSAKKYKENIEPLTDSLEKVLQMEGVSYNKIGSEEKEIGLIADEVNKLRPEYVFSKDGEIEGLHYQRMVADLIECVKTLNARIEVLENK